MITTDIGPTVLQNGPLEEKKLAKKGEIEGRIVTSRRFVKVLYFFFFSFFLFFFIFVLGLSFFQPGQPLVNLNKTNFSHWLIFIKQSQSWVNLNKTNVSHWLPFTKQTSAIG